MDNASGNEIFTKDRNKDVEVYSDFLLTIYDYFVLSFVCPFVWGCSKSKILALYNKHVSDTHLDIGVGTGYFLDKCKFPNMSPQITLLDLSENCLQTTAKRVARYSPEIVQADIFETLPLDSRKYNSIGMSYLIHCLPGTMQSKIKIFENIIPHMNIGARIFGATVLGKNIKLNAPGRKLLQTYNKHGIFCNQEDDLVGLKQGLSNYYTDVNIELSGAVALFSAVFK